MSRVVSARSRRATPVQSLAAAAGAALFARFADRVQQIVPAGAAVTVGLSGGIDSVVLLDLFDRLRKRQPIQLRAFHVHHGISPNADSWEAFCRRLAARRKIPLQVARVDIAPHRAQGLEGAARSARYVAFAQVHEGYLALAHHADDQAETLLVQLLRGAGLAGLAGMPEMRTLDPSAHSTRVRILRPLLDTRRAEIAAYARARRLRWVEDESNADTVRVRNAIRRDIIPRLEKMNPGAVESINRSSRFIQEAAALLRDLAQADLAAARDEGGLRLDPLRAMGEARAAQALRAFLERHGLRSLSASQTRELWSQLTGGRADARIEFRVQGYTVRRYRGRVWCEVAQENARPAGVLSRWDGSNPWHVTALGGHIVFRSVEGAGIRSQLLGAGHRVEVRARCDSVFKPAGARHRRALKKLFQEANIPSWRRLRLPFLYIDEALSWVPGIGIGADCAARSGEAGLEPCWCADPGAVPVGQRKVMLK